jgi:S1-C subfamily serine protease
MKRFIAYIMICLTGIGFVNAQTTAPTVSDVLENVLTSVVTVSVEKTSDTKQILGFRGDASDVAYEKILDLSDSKGSGSGFVIDRNGKKYIITNAHVIEDASEINGSIFAYSINRTKYEVKVVGGDSFYDIAVLEFIKTPGAEIKPIVFATKEPRIGEQVYAVGNPLGEYPYTVSDGIISAKNRVRGGLTGKFGFLQTTATVIWGNSGGPLVNVKGQVVGINSQIAFAKMGGQSIWQPQINFALEGLLSSRLVNDIIDNNGRVKRAFIGVELTQEYWYNPYSTTTTDGWELNDSLPVISGIMAGSPAEALLKDMVGYQLVKVGNVDIRNIEEAMGEFESLKPGDKVKLSLQKGTDLQVVEITTVELTPAQNEAIAYLAIEKNSSLKLVVLDDKPYVSFGDDDGSGSATDRLQGTGTKGSRSRGSEITTGTWEITAAGYDDDDYSSMWRVKSMSDLGVAIRLTASLGSVDLYLVRKGGDEADMQPKRISFYGTDDNKLLSNLWY